MHKITYTKFVIKFSKFKHLPINIYNGCGMYIEVLPKNWLPYTLMYLYY